MKSWSRSVICSESVYERTGHLLGYFKLEFLSPVFTLHNLQRFAIASQFANDALDLIKRRRLGSLGGGTNTIVKMVEIAWKRPWMD
jgi:hypothetical protein